MQLKRQRIHKRKSRRDAALEGMQLKRQRIHKRKSRGDPESGPRDGAVMAEIFRVSAREDGWIYSQA